MMERMERGCLRGRRLLPAGLGRRQRQRSRRGVRLRTGSTGVSASRVPALQLPSLGTGAGSQVAALKGPATHNPPLPRGQPASPRASVPHPTQASIAQEFKAQLGPNLIPLPRSALLLGSRLSMDTDLTIYQRVSDFTVVMKIQVARRPGQQVPVKRPGACLFLAGPRRFWGVVNSRDLSSPRRSRESDFLNR